ncbi:hypothetical protein [Arthrobacter bambusae]|uniref:hypothetical protein n=1 Tax=Arthrobacter bambusae TaxID=1338426 RepID=UPI002784BDA9|nr:hypothetical protein [Arthrobacter bambusae]MDQ0030946.1 hypothetical protein [Arthrobacter bambusae]MDQ0098921.1 hypothetical protein [Arthrobacter bambusae]
MNTHEPTRTFETEPLPAPVKTQAARARVGTVVWGLIVLALAALIIISKLGLVALNGNYVLIGLMIGAGAALVVGGLVSARSRKGSGPGPDSGAGAADSDHR